MSVSANAPRGTLYGGPEIPRRDLLRDTAVFSGLAVVATALEPFGVAGGESPAFAGIAETYKRETEKLSAFATWSSMVTELGPDDNRQVRIEDNADSPCRAGSVNKLATALAILDFKDRSILDLRQIVPTPDYAPDPGAKRELNDVETVDSLLTSMIVDSSNEAFRALLTVVPGEDINKMLRQKGLRNTFLEQSKMRGRFYTGYTTPRDTHNLLQGLTDGSLLSPSSSGHLLNLMLNSTFNAGIRRNMNDHQRHRVASKYGQLENRTNEVGIIFADSPVGKVPHTIFSFFASTLGSAPNLPNVEHAVYGLTRLSALAVHATLGTAMLQSCLRSRSGITKPIF